MFESEEVYNRAVESGVLNRQLISKLYNVPDEKILTCMFVSVTLFTAPQSLTRRSSDRHWLGK